LFGPSTESAVRALQGQARLPVTGVVDVATLQALDARLAAVRAPAPPLSSTLENARFASDAGLVDVAAGRATLAAGAHGPSVIAVQQALLDMGFNVWALQNDVGVSNVDGAFGDQTKTALGNFQVHAKLARTGVVDAATLAALDALAPAPGAKAWDAGQPSQAPIPSWGGRALRVVTVEDEHRTFLFDKSGVCTGIFADAVGAPGANTTPGLKIVNAKLDEAATKNTGVQLWNDPRAFGQRIVDLNWADGTHSGEELHGTYDYKDLGKDVSHGCVRHRNEDIITIFNAVSVGDLVAIVKSCDDPSLHR
jgi:peptidoglycan hydrolase-like protein with peptidoglycan-binding domain